MVLGSLAERKAKPSYAPVLVTHRQAVPLDMCGRGRAKVWRAEYGPFQELGIAWRLVTMVRSILSALLPVFTTWP